MSAGLAQRVLVQLSYAIGVAEPLSIFVDSYGTGTKSDQELVEIIRKNFDLRPGVIGMFILTKDTLSRFIQGVILPVRQLDLQKPVYRKTAAYGHFGMSLFASRSCIERRELTILPTLGNPEYTWEKPKQLVL